MFYDVFVGGFASCTTFKSFERSKAILRQRKKTFIVHECGVTQVLSEKSREVRSWFEVSEVILPPFFSKHRKLDFGTVLFQEQSAHSCKSSTLQKTV